MAAMAGAFCPNTFDTANNHVRTRLACTTAGCTTPASASSNAPAAARACRAASSAWAPAAVNQLAYGPAAFAIAADAGPCQAPPVTPTSPTRTTTPPRATPRPTRPRPPPPPIVAVTPHPDTSVANWSPEATTRNRPSRPPHTIDKPGRLEPNYTTRRDWDFYRNCAACTGRRPFPASLGVSCRLPWSATCEFAFVQSPVGSCQN